jgi:hypothetical protein
VAPSGKVLVGTTHNAHMGHSLSSVVASRQANSSQQSSGQASWLHGWRRAVAEQRGAQRRACYVALLLSVHCTAAATAGVLSCSHMSAQSLMDRVAVLTVRATTARRHAVSFASDFKRACLRCFRHMVLNAATTQRRPDEREASTRGNARACSLVLNERWKA